MLHDYNSIHHYTYVLVIELSFLVVNPIVVNAISQEYPQEIS